MRSARPQFPADPVWDISARVMERHAELQRELVRMVLSAPAEAVPAAKRAGVRALLFWMDDYAALWNAAEANAHRDKADVLIAGADALDLAGCWRATARRDEWPMMRWSMAGLAAFACSWSAEWSPFTGYCIGLAARELNRVHMLLTTADRQRRASLRALEDAAHPVVRRSSMKGKREFAAA